jgi:hypothetical protein
VLVFAKVKGLGGVRTLSDAMRRTTRSFIIWAFSRGVRRAKFVKIEPVVGLYTSYISSRRRATTFSGSGRWRDRVADSWDLLVGFYFPRRGRCEYYERAVADCVEVLGSGAESVGYVSAECIYEVSTLTGLGEQGTSCCPRIW